MQTEYRTSPRITKYDDLAPYLDDLHSDWQQMLIKIRDRIEAGSGMQAWFEATNVARIASDMVEHSDGEQQEAAKRLHAGALHLVALAKQGRGL